MQAKGSRLVSWFLIVVAVIANSACNGPQTTMPATTEAPVGTQSFPLESPIPLATSKTEIQESPPAPTSTPTISVTASPTLASVTITAVKGNLFIRRGPDLSFNPVSVLMNGQSARASGRDVLAEWVQIPIPGRPQETGWISIQSHYSQVNGEVMDLPDLEQTDWPVAAYLQNCTHHQMQADPGGIVILAVDYFPDNDVRVDPGIYTIRDTDVDGSPVVLTVEIREGSEIDIREDGNGEHRKCPET